MVFVGSSILQLPDELLSKVLDELDQPLYSVQGSIHRQYLSQESFSLPVSPSRCRATQIASFRSVCKRFASIGAGHQFARITTRFTQKDLDQLDQLSNWPHVARNVRKFSYLVKSFYVKGVELLENITPELENCLGITDLPLLKEKIHEQEQILTSKRDLKTLCKALSTFQALQHVQILRVQDQNDDLLLQTLQQHGGLARYLDVKWAPACAHSTRTIAAAVMISQSPCSRFSSPMLSPQGAEILATPISKFLSLAEKLTSLELHFDDSHDLDDIIISLSGAFKALFASARDMQAIHIGFPSHKPLDLRLEEVFHHIRWEKLVAFGIQAWKLNAEEIIALARRHKTRLRGLRLRDVLLREGSSWREVLEFLRSEMHSLDWVSLRRIGYVSHFDVQWAVSGAEVPDEVPGGWSGSEDDVQSDSEHGIGDVVDDESSVSDDHEDQRSLDEHDEDDPSAYGMEFPDVSENSPPLWLRCSCYTEAGLYPRELSDDGMYVSDTRRKLWEQWVIRHCPHHRGHKSTYGFQRE